MESFHLVRTSLYCSFTANGILYDLLWSSLTIVIYGFTSKLLNRFNSKEPVSINSPLQESVSDLPLLEQKVTGKIYNSHHDAWLRTAQHFVHDPIPKTGKSSCSAQFSQKKNREWKKSFPTCMDRATSKVVFSPSRMYANRKYRTDERADTGSGLSSLVLSSFTATITLSIGSTSSAMQPDRRAFRVTENVCQDAKDVGGL